MIAIVWEFIVKEEAVPAFQRAYGPDGEWAPRSSDSLFAQMHHTSPQEYPRFDAMFGELTVSERRVGLFLSL